MGALLLAAIAGGLIAAAIWRLASRRRSRALKIVAIAVVVLIGGSLAWVVLVVVLVGSGILPY